MFKVVQADVPRSAKRSEGAGLSSSAAISRPERLRDTAAARNTALLHPDQYDVIVGHPLQVQPDTRAYPWSAIVLLRYTFSNGTIGQGTGWFFGPSRVATAAHNLLRSEHGYVDRMELLAGWDGESAQDRFSVASRTVAVGWEGVWDEDADWAVIGTDHPTSSGWFGYRAYDAGYPDQLVLNVAGFPADNFKDPYELPSGGLNGSGSMYMDSGYLAGTTPERLRYTISTSAGMSGSPVFMTESEQRFAIGIHTQGLGSSNAGRRIDDKLRGFLDQVHG